MFQLRHSTHYRDNPARRGAVNPLLHHTIRGIALVLALIGWMTAIALPVYSQAGPEPSQRALTLEDRIGYQRAVEEVYWHHRIWPKQNGRRKPDLEAVMPEGAIRAKVEDYLSKSQALAVYWHRPITGEQLQAEMDRMARQTKQPAMLKELWGALRNDPYVIAECLARPVFVNRLIRNWYAHDERYQGELKARAEVDLRAYGSASQMRQMSGEYREVEWVKGERRRSQTAAIDQLTLSPDETGPLTLGELGRLQEDDERFYVTANLDKGSTRVRLATVEWKKEPFDTWWGRVRAEIRDRAGAVQSVAARRGDSPRPHGDPEPGYRYRLPVIGSGSGARVDDTWTLTPTPPDPRAGHTAVWTGSEMIVWGGVGADFFNTGGRYDPATDAWTPTTTTNAPSPRAGHTAVWTGSEMVVWGGENGANPPALNTGGRYDPATDTWTTTSTTNAPQSRWFHTAVWTGSEMIVWGGTARVGLYLNTGGRYDPTTDTWTATATTGAPSARTQHTAVWTGSEMIVWGGAVIGTFFNTGGRYDPATDTWTATTTTDAPSARIQHTAVWTCSEMIVWGGTSDSTGGRYDPTTDTWTATSTTDAPSARGSHTVVWTGTEMIVWGGRFPATDTYTDTGGRYDPATDTWTATSTTDAPSPRAGHTAVWTGSEMIVWGGAVTGTFFNTGGRYDPATDTWTATDTTPPTRRSTHAAVWTGKEMIVWAGVEDAFDTGGRYSASTGGSTTTHPFQ